FGVTISVAVMISLLEALTIAPMRCSQFLEVGRTNALTTAVDHAMEGVRKAYRRALERCLRWPKTVVVGSLVLFFASLFLVKTLKKELIPSQDQSRFLVNITLPLGVSMEQTDAVFKSALEPWMAKQEGLDGYYAAIGGFQGGQVNTGIFFVTMTDLDRR